MNQRDINRRQAQFERYGKEERLSSPQIIQTNKLMHPPLIKQTITFARIYENAGSGNTIKANPYTAAGVLLNTDLPGDNWDVHCEICGGSNLNEAIPYLEVGVVIPVVQRTVVVDDTPVVQYWCLWGFQMFPICVDEE